MNILRNRTKILYLANGRLNNNKFETSSWLSGILSSINNSDNVNISIAVTDPEVKSITKKEVDGIMYYFYPIKYKDASKYDFELEVHLNEIITEVYPDIIHIFGTEFPFALAAIKVCKRISIINRAVISIQGLTSTLSSHYTSGIPGKIITRYTLRDFIKRDNLKDKISKFQMRGNYEIKAITKATNVIGRTTYDKAVTLQINPEITYYKCNEILRAPFYRGRWTLADCDKYTIFVTQGYYPIKGLHFLLKAMPLILEKYPTTHIYVAGDGFCKKGNLLSKIKIGSYQKYLLSLIKKYELENNITFLGKLGEEEMVKRFLASNVYVSSSTVENESNSLSEAKILGVPSVASYVGGVIDRIEHGVDGFHYQHDAPYMLAHYINEIFGNEDLALNLSKNATIKANEINNKNNNNKVLLGIYQDILDKNRKL